MLDCNVSTVLGFFVLCVVVCVVVCAELSACSCEVYKRNGELPLENHRRRITVSV